MYTKGFSKEEIKCQKCQGYFLKILCLKLEVEGRDEFVCEKCFNELTLDENKSCQSCSNEAFCKVDHYLGFEFWFCKKCFKELIKKPEEEVTKND